MIRRKSLAAVALAAILLCSSCKVNIPFLGELDLGQAIANSTEWSSEQLEYYSKIAMSILWHCEDYEVGNPHSSFYKNLGDVMGTYEWTDNRWSFKSSVTNIPKDLKITAPDNSDSMGTTYNICILVTNKDFPDYVEHFYFVIDKNKDTNEVTVFLSAIEILDDTGLKYGAVLDEDKATGYLSTGFVSKTGIAESLITSDVVSDDFVMI